MTSITWSSFISSWLSFRNRECKCKLVLLTDNLHHNFLKAVVPRCFAKKFFLKRLQYSQKTTCAGVFFYKVSGLWVSCRHRCLPVNFEKRLRMADSGSLQNDFCMHCNTHWIAETKEKSNLSPIYHRKDATWNPFLYRA